VLTVAGSAANPLLGGALLFTYAVGTAAPMFGVAYFWDGLDLGRRAWLRGRTVRLGRWSVHSNNLIAGSLFILLGISIVAFEGTSAMSGMYDELGLGVIGCRLQSWVARPRRRQCIRGCADWPGCGRGGRMGCSRSFSRPYLWATPRRTRSRWRTSTARKVAFRDTLWEGRHFSQVSR
jgi:hypothetical protein